jgi:hypothetical protein
MMKKIYIFFLIVCYVSVVHAQNTDCSNSTILFREDFGGNRSLDPPIMSNQDMQLLYGDKIIGYTPSQSPAGAGLYSIRKEGYHHGNWWIWMDDHTHSYNYTQGYLLQVDGNNNSSGQFYRTKIDNLCVGSTLYFSMWAASVAPGYQRANLSIIIEDLVGTELQRLNTGEIPNAGGCNTLNCVSVSDPFACNDWTHYGITFTITGSTPSVIFKIMNNHSGSSGNDFVIDDIEIRLCTPSVNVIAPVEAVCLGSFAQFTGSFINDGTFTPPLEYQWLYSITGDLTNPNSWVAIAGGNSLTLDIPNVTANHQGYYRLAVAGAGNINLGNCRAMSDPSFLEVIACEPEPNSAVFYANDVYYQNLSDTAFCNKNVHFQAEIEGALHPDPESIKWFIGGTEWEDARDEPEWSKPFETGEYEIIMEVHFANGEIISIEGILTMEIFWIKIKNIRY